MAPDHRFLDRRFPHRAIVPLATVLLVSVLLAGLLAAPAAASAAPGPALENRTDERAGQFGDPPAGLETGDGTDEATVQPLSEHVDEGRRDPVENTSEYPHSAIVSLEDDLDDPGASGVLVEPDVVVTAAHVVEVTPDIEGLRAYPGRNGTAEPYGPVGVEEITYDERYGDGAYREYDFAVLTLEEPIGHETGTFDVQRTAALNRTTVPNVTVAGYPWDRPLHTLWEDTDTLHVRGGEAYYLDGQHEAWSGNSGGPIWTEIDGEPTLLGIVTHGPQDSAPIVNGTGFDEYRLGLIENASRIGEPNATFDVEVTGVPERVRAGETAVVNATVTNEGGAAGEQTVTATVGGEVVDEITVAIGSGERATLSFRYEPNASAVPSAAVTVASEDDATVANLTVEPALPSVGNADRPPRDLDGDLLYRDVTGDGRLTTADVAAFQAGLFEPAVQDHAAYYDFTGSGTVSHGDVVDLFRAATGLGVTATGPDAATGAQRAVA